MTEKTLRYRKVSDDLRARIVSGDYPVGSLLPTEQELCAEYEISRYTAREALRLLADDGLVERRQGRGTEVVSQALRAGGVPQLTSLAHLFTYASDTALVIDRILKVIPDDDLAAEFGRKPGRPWLLAEGIRRSAAGELICVAHVYLHEDFSELGPDLPSIRGPISNEIAKRWGVEAAEVHQDIELDRPEHGIAAQLGLKVGDWTVLLIRRYLAADDSPILISRNWHRPEGFSYSQIIRKE